MAQTTLETLSIAELLEFHKQIHGSYLEASLPSSDDDLIDVYKSEHIELVKELNRRGIYHPIVSPMDKETLDDMYYDDVLQYFNSIGQLVSDTDPVTLELAYPGISNTAMYVTGILLEKYSPNQPRDDFGMWVPYGQAGLGGGAASADDDEDRAKVRIWNADQKKIETISNNLFSKKVTARLVSNLMGNPVGGTVTIKAEGNGMRLRTVQDKLVRAHEGRFYRDSKGVTFRQKLTTRINLPEKTTAEIVNKQVEALKQVGVKRFLADAGRDYDRHHDYRNLARAGFNAPLSGQLRRELQKSTFEDIKDSKTISDLMQKPNGIAWWKTHGQGFLGEFDLSPGSISMKLLKQFLRSEG